MGYRWLGIGSHSLDFMHLYSSVGTISIAHGNLQSQSRGCAFALLMYILLPRLKTGCSTLPSLRQTITGACTSLSSDNTANPLCTHSSTGFKGVGDGDREIWFLVCCFEEIRTHQLRSIST